MQLLAKRRNEYQVVHEQGLNCVPLANSKQVCGRAGGLGLHLPISFVLVCNERHDTKDKSMEIFR